MQAQLYEHIDRQMNLFREQFLPALSQEQRRPEGGAQQQVSRLEDNAKDEMDSDNDVSIKKE